MGCYHQEWLNATRFLSTLFALEFDLVVQKRQKVAVCTLSRDPTAVQKLSVNEGTDVFNDLDLPLNVADGNEFLQGSDVGLSFRPLSELEGQPLPIGREIAAHEKHHAHDPGGEFAETNCNRDGVAAVRHALDKVIFSMVPDAKAFLGQTGAQPILRILL